MPGCCRPPHFLDGWPFLGTIPPEIAKVIQDLFRRLRPIRGALVPRVLVLLCPLTGTATRAQDRP